MIYNFLKNEICNCVKQIYNIENINFNIGVTKNIKLGDFSCNIAMLISKQLNKSAIDVANEIKDYFINKNLFEKVEVANPGFLNFFLNNKMVASVINNVLDQEDKYPYYEPKTYKYSVEFVSANPTGYLHIGHARNGAFGESLVSLIKQLGYPVVKEYVVNDAGNQMNKLASSILVRYLQLFSKNVDLPEDSYHGEEIIDVAKALKEKFGDKFINASWDDNFDIVDKPINQEIRDFGRNYLLEIIKNDLSKLGVYIDLYFSELTLHSDGSLEKTIDKLSKYTYKHEGALFLKTTEFGDDKDRVLVKSNGNPTYFLPDIAYHDFKKNNNGGVDKMIDIWGADHKSYIDRMQIALKCLGYNNSLDVVCMQLVKLIKDNKEFKLSKRSGNSLTLMDLINAIGKDAARWFLVSQSVNTHIELDVDMVLKHNNNNPLWYVEYAHARICQLLTKSSIDIQKIDSFDSLDNNSKELINLVCSYDMTLENAFKNYEIHKICNYLYSLAKSFHSYYANIKILNSSNKEFIKQNLALIKATKIIIKNGLALLGIDAYNEM